jgi:DNA-binding beta-propeller fold protein YncE
MYTRLALTGCAALFIAGCANESGSDDDTSVYDDAGVCIENCEDGPGPLGGGLATLAGWSQAGNKDGERAVARFDNPVNVLVAPSGKVYVADFNNHLIRVVSPDGTVSTLTRQADFQRPFGLALSRDGGTLYVQTDRNPELDTSIDSGTVWRVNVDSGNAVVIAANIGRPRGLAVLPDGRLVLVDYMHHTVRLMNASSGVITPLAGAADAPGRADGMGTAARFNSPYDVVVDGEGNLLVTDHGNHQIRKIAPGGLVTTIAGTGAPGWKDGTALQATFEKPQGLAIDAGGTLYVSDSENFCLRKISPDGQVATIAGDRIPGFRDSTDPMDAEVFGLEGIDVTSGAEYLYVADGNRGDDGPYNRVRRLTQP